MDSPAPIATPDGPPDLTADPWTGEQAIVIAVAPTLGHALSGPLAGFAFNTLRSTLGLDQTAPESTVAMTLREMSFDQMKALHRADTVFRRQMRSLRIDPKHLSEPPGNDTADSMFQRFRFSEIFAVIISVLFFALLSIFAWHPIPDGANATVLNVMVGAVATSFAAVVGYYFGSSLSSGRKDMMLYNSIPNKSPPS